MPYGGPRRWLNKPHLKIGFVRHSGLDNSGQKIDNVAPEALFPQEEARQGGSEMHAIIEVTRETGRSVTEDLGEMLAWLKKTGIQAQTLRAKQIIRGRVVYEAVFDTSVEADRFIKRFDA